MMEFISIEYYKDFFFNTLLAMVLVTFLNTQVQIRTAGPNQVPFRNLGIVFFYFTLLYIGLRPINGMFVDMITYANIFKRFEAGDFTTAIDDKFFNAFTEFSASVISVDAYFFICALLYILPLYIVSRKWFNNYWFYAFLMLVGSLSFWNYGTNGIRNGIATSLFLLGISREKKAFQIFWLFVAFNFHKSIIIPAAAFAFSTIYNQPKKIIWFWILSIPLSLAAGSFWQNLFSGLGLDDQHSYLTTDPDSVRFSNTGFRWDFLIYSASAVFIGWYFIHVKDFKDKAYYVIFNTYVIANAFWILVIRANFTNRFAYLSWFMMAIVIAYPYLRAEVAFQHLRKFGFILLAYFFFTYTLIVLL